MFKNMVQSKIEFPINYFLNILNHEKFSLYFSLFYALLLTLSFYPGILYTDSVPRWNLSIEFYNNGFLNFSNFPSHHPVIPSIIQSFFYGITKEVGLFIFLQVFSFSYLVFKIIEKVTISQYKNLIITIILISNA